VFLNLLDKELDETSAERPSWPCPLGISQNNLAEKSTGFAYLPPLEIQGVETTINEALDSLVYVVAEATEQSILNALCQAESLERYKGRFMEALPFEKVRRILDEHLVWP
jgi:D-aminopeptidase